MRYFVLKKAVTYYFQSPKDVCRHGVFAAVMLFGRLKLINPDIRNIIYNSCSDLSYALFTLKIKC